MNSIREMTPAEMAALQQTIVKRQRDCAEFLLGSPIPDDLRCALRNFYEHPSQESGIPDV